jgi:hypothetical protein
MKQSATPSGIILDEPYTNGLLVKACEGGYAKITFQSDYIDNVRIKARNPEVGQKALEMILLYDKAYVTSWFDNTDTEQLIKLGLLEIIETKWNKRTIEEDYAQSIKGLILADLDRKGVELSLERFDNLLPDVNSIYVGNIMTMAERLMPSIEKIFGSSQGNVESQRPPFPLPEKYRHSVDISQKRTPEDFQLAQQIQRSHSHLRNLLTASSDMVVPIFSNIKKSPPIKVDLKTQDPKITRVALGILMKEALFVPKIQTVDDVLRLRDDSRIKYFRAKVFEWCEKLRSGQVGSEDEIRQEIKDANSAIKDIGKYNTISMWATFLSAPAGIADFLLGIPFLSAITTFVGVSSTLTSVQKEHQHKWLLFGR